LWTGSRAARARMLGIALVPAGETCSTTQTAWRVSTGSLRTKLVSAFTPFADVLITMMLSVTEVRACGGDGVIGFIFQFYCIELWFARVRRLSMLVRCRRSRTVGE